MIERAFEIVERRGDEKPASQHILGHTGELRQAIQRQMQFRRQPASAQVRYAPSEASVQVLGAEKAQKSRLRIHIRDHSLSTYDLTGSQLHPSGTVCANDDPLNSSAGSDLGTS